MTNSRFLIPITGLFVASLLIANTMDTKIFSLFGLFLPAGIIVFPLSYVFGDLLTEVYGYAASRRVIWTGFAALLLMLLCYEISRSLPPAPFWTAQEHFEAVFTHVPRIVAASISAYFLGEFVNSYVVAKLKVIQDGKGMALRFLASTLLGQFVDTTVFVAIAFAGVIAFGDLPAIIFSAWAVKVGWEVVVLPLTVMFVSYIKRSEHVDVFDRQTDFNPFKLG